MREDFGFGRMRLWSWAFSLVLGLVTAIALVVFLVWVQGHIRSLL